MEVCCEAAAEKQQQKSAMLYRRSSALRDSTTNQQQQQPPRRRRGDHASFSYACGPSSPLIRKSQYAAPRSGGGGLRQRVTSAIVTTSTGAASTVTAATTSGGGRRHSQCGEMLLSSRQQSPPAPQSSSGGSATCRSKKYYTFNQVPISWAAGPAPVIILELDRALFASQYNSSPAAGGSTGGGPPLHPSSLKFLEELGRAYDQFYLGDEAPASLEALENALESCGRGLLEVERTLHRWMTTPLRQRPLPDAVSFASGSTEPYLNTTATGGNGSGGGGGESSTSSCSSCSRDKTRRKVSVPGDPGPSFFVVLERAPSVPCLIPYVSDCYDDFRSSEEYLHAWMLLSQTAAQALQAQSIPLRPIVITICSREFAQFATVTMLPQQTKAVVRPLTNKLWWANAEDRLALHDLCHGVAAWVKLQNY